MTRDNITSNVRPIDPERLRRIFGEPVDYERRPGDALRARAGQPPARAVLRRLGYAVPIAIAAFCVVWFAGQLLRAVLS